MPAFLAAALLLGASPDIASHATQIEHRGRRVDVTYRGETRVAHRQLGAAGAPGRPTSLRCAWRADVVVRREARGAAGGALVRTIAAAAPIEGSRVGWCETARSAIAAEVAGRGDIADHLRAVAAADRATLVAELDVAHGGAGG